MCVFFTRFLSWWLDKPDLTVSHTPGASLLMQMFIVVSNQSLFFSIAGPPVSMRSSPGSVDPPHAILRNVVLHTYKINFAHSFTHRSFTHIHFDGSDKVITLGTVSGVHVRPWNVSDLSMFYPFFHTGIGGTISRFRQILSERWNLRNSLRSAGRITAPVAFGFLLTSVKTLLATVGLGSTDL